MQFNKIACQRQSQSRTFLIRTCLPTDLTKPRQRRFNFLCPHTNSRVCDTYLVAILVAVGMFRASGAMAMLISPISVITDGFGMPAEALPMALLRALSGSGAYGILASLINDPAIGPDSYLIIRRIQYLCSADNEDQSLPRVPFDISSNDSSNSFKRFSRSTSNCASCRSKLKTR